MEKNIKIHIKDRVAVAVGDPVIVCGNGDYTVTFSFDEEWGGANVKTARFKFNTAEGPAHIDQPFTGDTVEAPELSNIREVEVGVFVGDLNTTTGASIRCKPCIRCGIGAPKDPTPDVYDELMELINEKGLNAYETAVKNGFEGSEEEWLESLRGAPGETGPQGPQGEKGEPGLSEIEEGSIDSKHIKNSAIESKHIADEAIDGHHLQNDSVGDGHIREGAIIESKIFDKAVTPGKLDRTYTESTDFEEFKTEFETFKTENFGRSVTEQVNVNVVSGFYAPTTEGSNKIGLNSSNYHCVVNAQAGEIYTIKTRCGSALRAYLVTDLDGTILAMSEKEAWTTTHLYDIELKIENNCNLIINAISSDEIGLKRTKTINKFIVNKLTGKTIACEGDSIMYGAGHSGGFAKIIADRNGMILTNNAVSGGTLASETYRNGVARHWISASFENLPAADYIVFNGGVNDRSLSVNGEGDPKVGTLSAGYDATLDLTTTLGGLEHCCKLLRSKYVGRKSGFIFPHRIWGYVDHWDTIYRAKMKEVLEKWGVPYLDLSDLAPPLNRIEELKATYTSNGDGWHPNEQGYKLFYCDAIEEWLKTL